MSYYWPDGQPVGDGGLDQGGPCAAAVFLDGTSIPDTGPDGTRVRDTHSFLLALNAAGDPVDFVIPAALAGGWRPESAAEAADGGGGADVLPLTRPGRSLLVLSRAEPQ